MISLLSVGEEKTLELFKHRYTLLEVIREHSLEAPKTQSQTFIFHQCCKLFTDVFDCTSVWAGHINKEQSSLDLLTCSPPSAAPTASVQQYLAKRLFDKFGGNCSSFTQPLHLYLDGALLGNPGSIPKFCIILPVGYHQQCYGFVVMHCRSHIDNYELNKSFIAHVINDIALALFSQDTALKLRSERDFNKEIVDTIQALMVTISPCGTILSFNRRAEEITGYKELEIRDKYWVDVLITPYKRLEFQQIFSDTLKGAEKNINFGAPLLTKDGSERYISWHGSMRRNIEEGQIGLVMMGIDETENMAAGQQLNMFAARWQKIFIAIQDPVLVVSSDNIILEANPATCAAAKKLRQEVIGQNVCDILHGGHHHSSQCLIEQRIRSQKSQITETHLHGLHGTYMLTVTPLQEENGVIENTLLVARNLTEEEVVRAEAIRAAQLAAIGELASGVAHEINNPINGIINYAQIILDDPDDPEAAENLTNIINESKRIAAIVANLLDFSRCRDDALSSSKIQKIVASSLELVSHLLRKDGITCSVEMIEPLPALICNEQQLQQVVLNMISNARYALNKKYPQHCPEKWLKIVGELHTGDQDRTIRLSFTDHGIGILPEIQSRLFDPFFSTKPKGEGTGLGLSISHGLIKDHGGTIKVQSNVGQWTSFLIEIPVKEVQEIL